MEYDILPPHQYKCPIFFLAKPYHLSHFYFCPSFFYLNILSSHKLLRIYPHVPYLPNYPSLLTLHYLPNYPSLLTLHYLPNYPSLLTLHYLSFTIYPTITFSMDPTPLLISVPKQMGQMGHLYWCGGNNIFIIYTTKKTLYVPTLLINLAQFENLK